MFLNISGEDANDIFKQISYHLILTGEKVSPRGLETLELQNVFIELENPKKSVITLPERKLSMKYLKGELKWYMSQDLSIKNIVKYSKFWKKIADKNGMINSNYGNIVFNNNNFQWDWCIKRLKNDKSSRQALINYNQPKYKYKGNKDFVCTIAQQFLIRNNKLDSIVFMRSQDLIYGFSYDIIWFTLLQKWMAREVGVELGKYYQFDTSLHVYKRYFKMIKEVIENDKGED